MGRAHRAPPEHRHLDVGGHQIDQQVGHGVRQGRGALDRGRIDAVLDHHARKRRAGQDRLADDPLPPGDQPAAGVEAARELVVVHRPIAAARHVVLAGPLHLDRGLGAGRLEDAHDLDDHVRIGDRAPAEEAARRHHVQLHLRGVDAHDLGAHRLIEVRHLVPGPDLERAVLEPCDRVERLHRGMREVGKLELGLDDLGGAGERALDVAVLARDRGIALRQPLVLGHQLGGAAGLGGALIPLDGQQVAPLERRPGVLGHDRDPARRLDHVDHALDLPGRRGVERRRPGAEQGRPREHRGQHARQPDVDRKLLPARGLGDRIQPVQLVVADVDPGGGVLELDLLRRRHLGRPVGERAEARGLARGVAEHAFGDPDLARGHRPGLGGGLDQHGARERARLPVALP